MDSRAWSIPTFIIAIFVANSVAAGNGKWGWFNPYVGLDMQVRRMDFKGGFGDNLFQHNSPQGNVYAGLRINSYMGIELGYEGTSTRTRESTLTTGDITAGQPVMKMVSPIIFKSKAKIRGPHVDLVGYYALSEEYPFELMGSVGISVFKGTFERRTLQAAGMARKTVRTLSAHKSVLRLMGGLQYIFCSGLGIRGTIGWVNTSKMVIFAKDDLCTPYVPELKPKNSTIFGLGVLWAF